MAVDPLLSVEVSVRTSDAPASLPLLWIVSSASAVMDSFLVEGQSIISGQVTSLQGTGGSGSRPQSGAGIVDIGHLTLRLLQIQAPPVPAFDM